jgi:hypothetical protein
LPEDRDPCPRSCSSSSGGGGGLLEFYEEAYFYNGRLTLTFKGMETRYR